MPGPIQALERATVILDLVERSDRSMQLRDIAQEVDLSKTTVHGILQTLTALEYLDQDPDTGAYSLGPRMSSHDVVELDGNDLRSAAMPWADGLALGHGLRSADDDPARSGGRGRPPRVPPRRQAPDSAGRGTAASARHRLRQAAPGVFASARTTSAQPAAGPLHASDVDQSRLGSPRPSSRSGSGEWRPATANSIPTSPTWRLRCTVAAAPAWRHSRCTAPRRICWPATARPARNRSRLFGSPPRGDARTRADAVTDQRVVAAIDLGTTSARCMVFDHARPDAGHRPARTTPVASRSPGWVEQDAAGTVAQRASGRARGAEGGGAGRVQRRRARNCQPAGDDGGLGPPDGRAGGAGRSPGRTPGPGPVVDQIEPHAEDFRRIAGLDPASYFAAPRLRWLFDNVRRLDSRARKGEVLFGTLESWLIWNLTGGPEGRRPRHRRHQRQQDAPDGPAHAGVESETAWRYWTFRRR